MFHNRRTVSINDVWYSVSSPVVMECLINRDDIKKKHPEFKPTEITKMLGEEWQKLSEAEKESYGSMAENDKKRYQSEMETYDSNGGANGGAGDGVGNGPAIPNGDMNGAEAWRA